MSPGLSLAPVGQPPPVDVALNDADLAERSAPDCHVRCIHMSVEMGLADFFQPVNPPPGPAVEWSQDLGGLYFPLLPLLLCTAGCAPCTKTRS